MPLDSNLRDLVSSLNIRPIKLVKIHGKTGNLLFASYEENVTFDGDTYIPYPFKVGMVRATSSGSLPGISVTTASADGLIIALLEGLDDLRGCQLDVITVFEGNLDDPTCKLIHTFNIESIEGIIEEQIEIKCTARFHQNVKLPKRTFYRDTCQWVFMGEGCWEGSASPWSKPSGFLHEEVLCKRTRAACEYHNNFTRFSGAPGIPWNNPFIF